jgi:hypothetical protein
VHRILAGLLRQWPLLGPVGLLGSPHDLYKPARYAESRRQAGFRNEFPAFLVGLTNRRGFRLSDYRHGTTMGVELMCGNRMGAGW